jgi:short-subunit dehydrogenase
MREAGKGRILIVGALEGIAAVPYQGLYSASEFALEALAESLRLEVSAFGIDVGIIELGSFRTAFGQKRIITAGAAESSPYKKMLATALGVLSSNEASGLEPLIAARAIYAAITARRMRSRKTTGPFTQRFIAYCRRCFPARAFEHGLLKYFRLY